MRSKNRVSNITTVACRVTDNDNPPFLDEFGLTFPVVLDEAEEVASTYRIIGQPASIFVDKDGVIHQVFQDTIIYTN